MTPVSPWVRPATPDDLPAIGRVHVDTWRATYPGIVPASHLDGLDAAVSAERWARTLAREDGTFVGVVERGGVVVGFASAGPNADPTWPFDGVLHALYLLPAYHGGGDGRRLIRFVARQWSASGHRSMMVWVFPQNPACGFYAALGGRPCGAKLVIVGGESLPAVAFGWDDVEGTLS